MRLVNTLLAVGMACGSLAWAESPAEREVRCAEIAFSRSAEARDAASFRDAIHPEAWFAGKTLLEGGDAVAAAWAPFFAADGPTIKWRPQFAKVTAGGELGFTRGPYRVESAEGVTWGWFNSVWKRTDDGAWKVIFDAGTAQGEQLPEATRALLDRDDDCPADE